MKIFKPLFLSLLLLTNNIYAAITTKTPNYEFVLFHNYHCGYCQKFTPVLKQYASLHKISIRAFATDDPNIQNILKQFFSKNTDVAVPTLFIVTAKDLAYPVSRGYLSYQELDLRMQELLPRITHYENKKS